MASIFLLESRDRKKLLLAIEKVKRYLKGSDINSTKTFLVWMKKFFEANSTYEEAHKAVNKIKSAKEATTMLAKTIEQVKQGFREEGIKIGIQKGRKEGFREGREEGLEKGIRDRTIETARKMIEKNFLVSEISEITGLTEKEIKKLRNKG